MAKDGKPQTDREQSYTIIKELVLRVTVRASSEDEAHQRACGMDDTDFEVVNVEWHTETTSP